MKKFIVGSILLFFLIGCTTQTQTPVGEVSLSTQPKCTTENYVESVCEDVPYQDLDCKTVNYTDKECSLETVIYNTDVSKAAARPTCIDTKTEILEQGFFGINQKTKEVCIKYQYNCQFVFNNLDDVPANVDFSEQVNTDDGKKLDLSILNSSLPSDKKETVYIQPKSSKTIYFAFSTDIPDPANLRLDNSYCVIAQTSVPTKTVCKDVLKTREECNNVTKYKTECKDVSRTREICS